MTVENYEDKKEEIRAEKSKKKLLLVDGHSILNRAFYGMPDLTNAKGMHTGAVYGFLNILFSQLDELELAYAVTVHKSQGSEFPVVIMPVSWFPPMLATRNLLYTGVTRGKKAVVLVGSENKLKGMVDNDRISERFSGLGVRLKRFLGMDDM